MSNYKDKIEYLGDKKPHLDNKDIAQEVGCSERLVRRYLGPWKERVKDAETKRNDITKTMLLYDPHIPYHSRRAYKGAINYALDYKPDQIILAGDFVDFYKISFWKTDPNRMKFSKEKRLAINELIKLRDLFPDTKIILLEGNHEVRLSNYLMDKAPELYDLPELAIPELLKLEPLDIEYISNKDRLEKGLPPISLGSLYVLHGHEVKMGWGGVNLARTMYLKTHVNVIFGHHHQSQQYIMKKLDHEHDGAWLVGGLCRLSQPGNAHNNWVNGFATVEHNDVTGMFSVKNKMIIKEQIV